MPFKHIGLIALIVSSVGALTMHPRPEAAAPASPRAAGGLPWVGEIMMFAGDFAPRGWALCEGQLLQVAEHDALFKILGTTFGGDGITTFALPDMRGRAALGAGNGPGLAPKKLGSKGVGGAGVPKIHPKKPLIPHRPSPVHVQTPPFADLIGKLQSTDRSEQATSIEALAKLGPLAVPHLLAAQKDAQNFADVDRAIRLWRNAQAALLKIRASISMLESMDEKEQAQAIESLARHGEAALPMLLAAQKEAQGYTDLDTSTRLWGNAQAAIVKIRATLAERRTAAEALAAQIAAKNRQIEAENRAIASKDDRFAEAGSFVAVSYCIALGGEYPSKR